MTSATTVTAMREPRDAWPVVDLNERFDQASEALAGTPTPWGPVLDEDADYWVDDFGAQVGGDAGSLGR